MDETQIPVGISRHEDGSIEIEPLSGQPCPNCGYEHFAVTAGFSTSWNPTEASQTECDECGAVFKLYAVLED